MLAIISVSHKHMVYTNDMKILLSDGSGLTARQVAGRLSDSGHDVEVLSPDRLCLCRLTHHVRRVHAVPSYGADPLGWLDAALAVYRRGRFDLLFPTQEQVAVLSHSAGRLADAGIPTAGPPFDALRAGQDKVSASATPGALRVPPPETPLAGPARVARLARRPLGGCHRARCGPGVRRHQSPPGRAGQRVAFRGGPSGRAARRRPRQRAGNSVARPPRGGHPPDAAGGPRRRSPGSRAARARARDPGPADPRRPLPGERRGTPAGPGGSAHRPARNRGGGDVADPADAVAAPPPRPP